MSNDHLSIEIALRAGQVAKHALEFTDSVQDALLLKLRYKQLTDSVEGLRKAVAKAAADTKESQPHIAQQR